MAFKIPPGSLGKLFKQPFCLHVGRSFHEEGYNFAPVGPNALARFFDTNACSTLIPHPHRFCAIRKEEVIMKTLQGLLEAHRSGQNIPYVVEQGGYKNQFLEFTYTGDRKQPPAAETIPQNMTPAIPSDFKLVDRIGSVEIHEPIYANGEEE